MPGGSLSDWLHPLAAPAQRAVAAQALAERLGVERIVLYVKDPALDVMLPAPGMPKTLAGGARWRDYLRRCLRERRPEALVDLPAGTERWARAVARDGAAVILLGGEPDAALLDELEREFPLLSALLCAQQALQLERAEAADAREAAARAHTLAQALDTARAASAELNLQLRREHERKDEFLAMLAHELRNPLSPLVHSLAILKHKVGADESLARQLTVMSRQLQQLTRLVDDLLDVSRVSRGLIELRRERVALQAVIEDALESTRPLIEARRHVVVRSGTGADLYVNADRVRLTQVFANLFGNAAKYTEPGGRLSISVVPDEHRVSVVVQDTGMGIPQNMLVRIFDMFTQVPASLDRAQGGLGIGLTLVRRLVELHGGRVSAYSRGVGEGSTFTVSLPVVAMPPPGTEPVDAPAAASVPHAASAGPVPGQRKPRVLVVDDNRDAAESLGEVLGYLGAEVRLAHDGREALEAAGLFSPDLILLDIGLPGMNGYDAARQLRAAPEVHARLVALTGYGTQQDRQRALDAGFDDHLVKPLSPEATQQLLDQLTAMHPVS